MPGKFTTAETTMLDHDWSDETVKRKIVLEANGKDFFKFSFGKAGIVSVTIKTE